MKVTIDKAGRLVVPKNIRTLLQIRPGDELEIEEEAGVINLRPARTAATLMKQGGMLIVAAAESGTSDLAGEITRGYAEREERVLGTWSSTTPRS